MIVKSGSKFHKSLQDLEERSNGDLKRYPIYASSVGWMMGDKQFGHLSYLIRNDLVIMTSDDDEDRLTNRSDTYVISPKGKKVLSYLNKGLSVDPATLRIDIKNSKKELAKSPEEKVRKVTGIAVQFIKYIHDHKKVLPWKMFDDVAGKFALKRSQRGRYLHVLEKELALVTSAGGDYIKLTPLGEAYYQRFIANNLK